MGAGLGGLSDQGTGLFISMCRREKREGNVEKSQSGREPRIHPEIVAANGLVFDRGILSMGVIDVRIFISSYEDILVEDIYHDFRKAWLPIHWGGLQTQAFFFFFFKSLSVSSRPWLHSQALYSLMFSLCIKALTVRPEAFYSKRN